MPAHSSRFVVTSNLLLLVLSTLLALIGVEIGYRIFLVWTMPDRFHSPYKSGDHPSLWYYQQSPYRYSEKFGYEYVPGIYNGGAIDNGKVTGCFDSLMNINERGNVGRIRGSYEHADLRILVFGDSFGVSGRAGPQWPEFLQDFMSERSDRDVHVVNFSRDGYGILQMFDLAASKVVDWKPDLVVIAFITPDLTRGRFWRSKVVLDGRERIMTSVVPGRQFSWRTAGDVYLMHSGATAEWCQQAHATQRLNDPIVVSLEETLLIGRQLSSHLANAYTATRSYVADLIFRGDPFYSAMADAPKSIWPRHDLSSFDQDPGMKEAVRKLKATSIPLILFHLAHYPEMKLGDEFGTATERDLALMTSLVELIGQPIHGTLEHIRIDTDLDELVINARNDFHPSVEGSIIYADAVATVLMQSDALMRLLEGYIER